MSWQKTTHIKISFFKRYQINKKFLVNILNNLIPPILFLKFLIMIIIRCLFFFLNFRLLRNIHVLFLHMSLFLYYFCSININWNRITYKEQWNTDKVYCDRIISFFLIQKVRNELIFWKWYSPFFHIRGTRK